MSTEVIVATSICVALGLLWLLQPKYEPSEPKPIPHTLPFLGLIIPWIHDRRGFFVWADAKANARPFSMLIGGRKHYVFNRPSDVSTIFRKPKNFSIQPFIRMITTNLFGLTGNQADTLGRAHDDLHKLYDKYLLRSEHYDPVVVRYFGDLGPRLRTIQSEAEDGVNQEVVRDAWDLLLETVAASSTVAYFGKKPIELNPDITKDLSDFVVTGFWKLFAGIPVRFLRTTYAAKRKIYAALERGVVDALATGDDNDISEFTKAHAKLHKDLIGRESSVTTELSFLFGFLANSTPTTYVTLLRILSNPDLLPSIRAELADSGFPSATAAEMPSIVPHKLPLLRSVYFESIRLHVVSSSIREVLETTEITTKDSPAQTLKLTKGGVVNMPSVMLHFNPDINPRPDEFIPHRFVGKEQGGWGQNPATSTRAFGGGASYCPGRVFAERQIIGFLASLIWGFDIAVEESREWELPQTAEFDDCAKAKRAFVRLRKRAEMAF